MSKLKGTHASKKAHYVGYKASNRVQKNREAKLQRHLKKHPNDAVASAAVGRPVKYRKTPVGQKRAQRAVGLIRLDEKTWTYVSDTNFMPGHPVLNMLSKAKFSSKLKDNAKWRNKEY